MPRLYHRSRLDTLRRLHGWLHAHAVYTVTPAFYTLHAHVTRRAFCTRSAGSHHTFTFVTPQLRYGCYTRIATTRLRGLPRLPHHARWFCAHFHVGCGCCLRLHTFAGWFYHYLRSRLLQFLQLVRWLQFGLPFVYVYVHRLVYGYAPLPFVAHGCTHLAVRIAARSRYHAFTLPRHLPVTRGCCLVYTRICLRLLPHTLRSRFWFLVPLCCGYHIRSPFTFTCRGYLRSYALGCLPARFRAILRGCRTGYWFGFCGYLPPLLVLLPVVHAFPVPGYYRTLVATLLPAVTRCPPLLVLHTFPFCLRYVCYSVLRLPVTHCAGSWITHTFATTAPRYYCPATWFTPHTTARYLTLPRLVYLYGSHRLRFTFTRLRTRLFTFYGCGCTTHATHALHRATHTFGWLRWLHGCRGFVVADFTQFIRSRCGSAVCCTPARVTPGYRTFGSAVCILVTFCVAVVCLHAVRYTAHTAVTAVHHHSYVAVHLHHAYSYQFWLLRSGSRLGLPTPDSLPVDFTARLQFPPAPPVYSSTTVGYGSTTPTPALQFLAFYLPLLPGSCSLGYLYGYAHYGFTAPAIPSTAVTIPGYHRFGLRIAFRLPVTPLQFTRTFRMPLWFLVAVPVLRHTPRHWFHFAWIAAHSHCGCHALHYTFAVLFYRHAVLPFSSLPGYHVCTYTGAHTPAAFLRYAHAVATFCLRYYRLPVRFCSSTYGSACLVVRFVHTRTRRFTGLRGLLVFAPFTGSHLRGWVRRTPRLDLPVALCRVHPTHRVCSYVCSVYRVTVRLPLLHAVVTHIFWIVVHAPPHWIRLTRTVVPVLCGSACCWLVRSRLFSPHTAHTGFTVVYCLHIYTHTFTFTYTWFTYTCRIPLPAVLPWFVTTHRPTTRFCCVADSPTCLYTHLLPVTFFTTTACCYTFWFCHIPLVGYGSYGSTAVYHHRFAAVYGYGSCCVPGLFWLYRSPFLYWFTVGWLVTRYTRTTTRTVWLPYIAAGYRVLLHFSRFTAVTHAWFVTAARLYAVRHRAVVLPFTFCGCPLRTRLHAVTRIIVTYVTCRSTGCYIPLPLQLPYYVAAHVYRSGSPRFTGSAFIRLHITFTHIAWTTCICPRFGYRVPGYTALPRFWFCVCICPHTLYRLPHVTTLLRLLRLPRLLPRLRYTRYTFLVLTGLRHVYTTLPLGLVLVVRLRLFTHAFTLLFTQLLLIYLPGSRLRLHTVAFRLVLHVACCRFTRVHGCRTTPRCGSAVTHCCGCTVIRYLTFTTGCRFCHGFPFCTVISGYGCYAARADTVLYRLRLRCLDYATHAFCVTHRCGCVPQFTTHHRRGCSSTPHTRVYRLLRTPPRYRFIFFTFGSPPVCSLPHTAGLRIAGYHTYLPVVTVRTFTVRTLVWFGSPGYGSGCSYTRCTFTRGSLLLRSRSVAYGSRTTHHPHAGTTLRLYDFAGSPACTYTTRYVYYHTVLVTAVLPTTGCLRTVTTVHACLPVLPAVLPVTPGYGACACYTRLLYT